MERRSFLQQTGLGLAGAAVWPALAQAAPTIKWRMASSYSKNLDTIYGTSEFLVRRLAEMSGGKFQIQLYAAGEIVPATAVHDAVKEGTVESGFTNSAFYFGKEPTYCLDSAIPFGMTVRQMKAWYRHGNGGRLMGEFLARANIVAIPAGNTGVQMGGWYRKEIRSVADLQGMKMRVVGIAGAVLAKLGVIPQLLPGSDLYPALEKGVIDAVEWVGPYDDQKLGFSKVARYYYYPSWWEGSAQMCVYVNAAKWAELPGAYQAMLMAACAEADAEMVARYDARNPVALRQLLAARDKSGQPAVKILPFPKDVMEASYQAAMAYYAEASARYPDFKAIYTDYKKFMDEQNFWFRVAENEYAKFMFSRKG